MPVFKVEHACPLSSLQQDQLAEAFTKIYSTKFTTPSLFVNVTFTDVSSQAAYVAGKRVRPLPSQLLPESLQLMANPLLCSPKNPKLISSSQRTTTRLLVHVRPGPSRTMEDFNSLVSSLIQAWADIVGNTGKQELRAVFILGDVVAAAEAGFAFPAAGEDKKWLKENYKEFEQKAKLGDEEFQDLMHELREREDLKDAVSEV